jgi:flagellar hook protein FlgE
MSLFGMMKTSASGMTAQANLLGTVSDNIANSSTTGYKSATEEFSTLVLESGVSDYQSGAVESHTRTFISQQGGFDYTSSPTDLAIRGQGFFVVSAPDGTMSLTRAGSFVKNGDGDLVNAAGYKLMAYPSAAGATPVANGLAGLSVVNISTLGMIAQPSAKGNLFVNLPPGSSTVGAANLPSANTAGSQFTKMTSIVVYDNIGAEKTLDVYETKTAANIWEFAVFDRAQANGGGGFPYASGPLVTASLVFNPATGALASTSPTSVAIPVPNGAMLNLDLSKSTELAADYAVRDVNIDGSAPSAVDHVDINAAGDLVAVYKNGSRAVSYSIPLANVPSPDNLEQQSGNIFRLTADSGGIIVGKAGSNGFGDVVPSALEKSTVDIASELTTMIESQHSYTANSKVFQTAADLMDVLINLKR